MYSSAVLVPSLRFRPRRRSESTEETSGAGLRPQLTGVLSLPLPGRKTSQKLPENVLGWRIPAIAKLGMLSSPVPLMVPRRSSLLVGDRLTTQRRVAESSADVSCADDVEAEITLVVHYYREGSLSGWGLHVWGGVRQQTDWASPLWPEEMQGLGDVLRPPGGWVSWRVPAVALKDSASGSWAVETFLLPHREDEKDCTWRFAWTGLELPGKNGQLRGEATIETWLVEGLCSKTFDTEPDLLAIPKGSLGTSRALWLERHVIAVPADWGMPADDTQGAHDVHFFLHSSASASLELKATSVSGADVCLPLTLDPHGIPELVRKKFPHVASYATLRLPENADVDALVTCQLAVSGIAGGRVVDATGVQVTGVLDDCYFYEGPLGPTVNSEEHLASSDSISLRVWAPTAQTVSLLLFQDPHKSSPVETLQMSRGGHGEWTIHGCAEGWLGLYYQYQVVAYHPETRSVHTCVTTDPYSQGLSANGEKSYILDLKSPQGCTFLEARGSKLSPEGWEGLALEKPVLTSFADVSLYELHIRDFSAGDVTVRPELRGTYLAFTEEGSNGVNHLRALGSSGLSHVHLLPSYDFASVNEDKSTWQDVDEKLLGSFPPDSELQQEAVTSIQDKDAFNWGYDPVHWGVPDGSYATDPDGPIRTLEHRAMVQALNRLGLRVVLDVVYNHLNSSGPHCSYSVLDKVVPGYYVRRNLEGGIEGSACCNNTASEHAMVERLIVDDVVRWATLYKVDGFRFDLMGHLMKRTLLKAREALDALTVDKDGVDGSKIYMYGEGWDFGEVKSNGRGENGSQLNLAGTAIGSFNDRFRDAVLGGSPFGAPQQQGFLTGLLLQPNEWELSRAQRDGGAGSYGGANKAWLEQLQHQTDWVQIGLAGNLRSFAFASHASGASCCGFDLKTMDGTPVAYAAEPVETINYVSAHDNETLFDIVNLKASGEASGKDRWRMCQLALAMLAVGQGIPFFHAGDEMLRSKSLDRDSYNSGDWFNKLDFAYESNNFGVGLPVRSKNGEKWDMMRPVLRNALLKPAKEDIVSSVELFKTFLRIRYSSPLFRLGSSTQIQERLTFLPPLPAGTETPTRLAGVVAMLLSDGEEGTALGRIDPRYKSLLVLLSVRPDRAVVDLPQVNGKALALHPEMEGCFDEEWLSCQTEASRFEIPGRSITVLVEEH